VAASPGDHVERIYGQYREAIRKFFESRTKSASLAEDLAQTVYLKLLNCRTLATVEDPKLFIYAIAWNVLRTELKRSRYEQRFSVSLDGELEAELAANRHLWVDDSSADVDVQYFLQALRGLSARQLEVFGLHYIDRLTVEQIFQKTGVGVNTVKKDITRILVVLHAYYGNDSDPNGTPAKERT
jgi:RNA polymerase sigma factor (sigma-70 family)